MEIDELTYDIDNVDVEGEMEAKDIEDEEEAVEEELNEKEAAAAEESFNKARTKLTSSNLDIDLKCKNEADRKVYTWKKDNVKYTGYVIYKMDKDTYIFSVKDKDGSKSKKFKLSEIN